MTGFPKLITAILPSHLKDVASITHAFTTAQGHHGLGEEDFAIGRAELD